MRFSITMLRYIAIAAVVLAVGGLVWWYFLLRSQGGQLAAGDAGRGAGASIPSGNEFGSTYSNILESQGVSGDGTGVLVSGSISTTTAGASALPQLFEISKTPVAGAGFVGSGTSLRLRFVERGTGYVLELDPRDGTLTRLTNTLIPRVYEASVARNGKIALRSIGDDGGILTSIGSTTGLSASGAPGTLSQKTLPSGIRSFLFSPSGDEVFYLVRNTGENAKGIIAQNDGTKPRQLFASAVAGWDVHWLAGRTVIVQHSSDRVGGYAYEVKSGGVLSPLLRNVPGLTALPHPTSSAMLYGGSSGGVSSLFVQLDQNTAAVALPIRTFADKCVWAPGKQAAAFCAVPQRPGSAGFFDLWLRGAEHSADAWWRVDASAGTATLLYSPGNVLFDAENPLIDDSGMYIAFMDATDKSLWLLRVSQ